LPKDLIIRKVYISGKIWLTMVQIDTTKISSKGQIVIPSSMRSDLKEGDTLLIIKSKNAILLKKADDLDEKFKEDLEFAKRTEEAYKRIEAGEYISLDSENIFEEMKKW
jgi:AbrB family looped-hinge helix DNA binding protein